MNAVSVLVISCSQYAFKEVIVHHVMSSLHFVNR